MKYNLEHFSELIEKQLSDDVIKMVQQSENLYTRLTSDLSMDFSSDEIQNIVSEIMVFVQEHTAAAPLGKPYCDMLVQAYSGDYIKAITDSKYGAGSSDYIVKAFRYFSENHRFQTS